MRWSCTSSGQHCSNDDESREHFEEDVFGGVTRRYLPFARMNAVPDCSHGEGGGREGSEARELGRHGPNGGMVTRGPVALRT